MKEAKFEFKGELVDFLTRANAVLLKSEGMLEYSFFGAPAVRDVIQAFGVPHVEVGCILVNGDQAGWAYNLQNEDQVRVSQLRYPVNAESSVNVLLRPPLEGELKFVLDGHLGRLAAYLRMLGVDTVWQQQDEGDEELANCSARDNRILLTRDIGLLKRNQVVHGRWIRNTHPKKQVREVFEHFDVEDQIRSFTRCMRCNGLLAVASKAAVESQLLPETLKHYDEFFQCTGCRKAYWKGPHYEKMQNLVNEFSGRSRIA